MSQSTEKRARRAWRNRMQNVAGDDWEKFMHMAEKKIITQKIIIIILSITTAAAVLVAVWGWI